MSDFNGGAAKASYRRCKELVNISVDSQMLVQDKTSDNYTIGSKTKREKGWGKIKPTLGTIPLQFYKKNQ